MDINNVSIDLGGPALPAAAHGPEDEQGNDYDKGAQLLSGATEVDLARVKQAMQADGRGSEKIIAVWRVSEENKNVVGAVSRRELLLRFWSAFFSGFAVLWSDGMDTRSNSTIL